MSKTLFEPPDRPTVWAMDLVGDCQLACLVEPGFADPERRRTSDRKKLLQVWNLRALDAMRVTRQSNSTV